MLIKQLEVTWDPADAPGEGACFPCMNPVPLPVGEGSTSESVRLKILKS